MVFRRLSFAQTIRWMMVLLFFGAALILVGPATAHAAGDAIVLDDQSVSVQLWPATRVLVDAERTLTIADVMGRPERFQAPDTPYPTFGVRKDAIWMRVALDVRCTSRCPWVLDIDYPSLGRVDVYLTGPDGSLVQQARLGTQQPTADRPVGSRSHSVVLNLMRNQRQELLLRVETAGAMIVPVTINSPAAFHSRSLNEQMLQGLLGGLGVCLLLYSLAQGIGLREPLFLKYAMLISGSIVFSLLQFGIGMQYLWTDNLWVEQHIGPLAAMVAACGSFLFIEEVLAGPDSSRRFSRIMKGGALFTVVLAVAYASGFISTRIVTAIVSVLALVPVMLGIPGAVARARRGDPVGISFLVAWFVYLVATAIIILVINGRALVNFWTMHSFQFGATIDMLIFMRVLGLRMKAVHLQARNASQERDAMRSLAHTDPLTGLPNRRGLNMALNGALATAVAGREVAVYMLDLDGFKPVNDQHGHDVGDELLIAVSRRLQSQMRSTDVVARLGGDEFVVMMQGLQTEEQAATLGQQLVSAFAAPFPLQRQTCQVGLTVGFAMAPTDARDADTLLKYADAGMYVGKGSGKGCLVRGGREVTVDPMGVNPAAG